MEKGKRNSRFHEALQKIYFPPSPSPQKSSHNSLRFYVDKESETEGSNSLNPIELVVDDEDDFTIKLTRSQRKRIRKKKLKEAASARRTRFIGPKQLPSPAQNVEF
ncbi:hypothetical protein ZOSMA_114G00190 [Zostera marina]|uniref:Uncharacterized protein n=1 Tax=Zostera marina TaxID=29655 RepID=A0A0K9Q4H1_ZOSMR|nr:hypothetical protein ZOSMA_114G00190 [Zostera marina]